MLFGLTRRQKSFYYVGDSLCLGKYNYAAEAPYFLVNYFGPTPRASLIEIEYHEPTGGVMKGSLSKWSESLISADTILEFSQIPPTKSDIICSYIQYFSWTEVHTTNNSLLQIALILNLNGK